VAAEIWVTGPLIEITLHGSSASAPTESLEGIIDTGASVICLDSRVANRLGLVAINRQAMQVADGSEIIASIYMAEMSIAGLGFKEWVEVYALPMARPSARVLLGRSFLKNYLVTYNGREDLFHFYPADDGPSNRYEEFDG
jgi:predicted aspartyl protease